jgi:hypothetical protein
MWAFDNEGGHADWDLFAFEFAPQKPIDWGV